RPSAVVAARQGQPKERRHFFLDVDDGLSRGKLAGQALILVTQARDVGRVDRRGGVTASSRGERSEGALRPMAAPLGEMRRIQPFPAQECSELTRHRTLVRFLENPQLIAGRELTPTR